MENTAKGIEIDANAGVEEQPSYFDKIPDEVLEMIISYVPYKKACFLVNKRFNKEAINATRNCRLVFNLDDPDIWLQNSDQVLKIERKFDEINLKFGLSKESSQGSKAIDKLMQIIANFEQQTKTFKIKASLIEDKLVMRLLSLMQNLECLEIDINVKQSPIKRASLQFKNLKCLKVTDSSSLLIGVFTCPVLEEFALLNHRFFYLHRNDSSTWLRKFVQRHTHLKHLVLPQCDLELTGLKLEKLEISQDLDSVYNTSEQTSTFCSALSIQTELKTLKLPYLMSMNNNQSFRCISKLQKLVNLVIILKKTEDDEPISGGLANILLLKQLKVLNIETEELELLRPLTAVKNLHLEELELCLPSNSDLAVQRTIFQSLAENLPNLKKVSLTEIDIEVALIIASKLRSLNEFQLINPTSNVEKIKIPAPNFNISNFSLLYVPIFVINSSLLSNRPNVIKACVQMMPNVSKISYKCYKPNENSDDMSGLLKFRNLKEFRGETDFMLLPQTINAIKEQGQHLNKMIFQLSWDKRRQNLLPISYGDEFPIQVLNKEKDILVMERA